MAAQMKDVRRQMEEDEDLSALMAGLRGSNLNEEDFASADVNMRLLDFDGSSANVGSEDALPLVYSPTGIAAYWGARKGAIAKRIVQLTSVAGSFVAGLALDAVRGTLKENEVKRAIELRDIMQADLPQVVVPKTYAEYTSRKVLTTSWVEGEKLSQSTADDVGDLVNDIKIGMIEAVSHLIHRDYDAIADDFVTLDFIDPGVDTDPIKPALARVFDAALAGGGAKAINFQDLAADLAQITFDFPFKIPPYFAIVIRAIGVLEGIALTADEDFAIIDEAYPYLSRRLLTDDSPRLRAALRYMVYGKGTTFDADRVIDLLEALETYAAASRTAMGDGAPDGGEKDAAQDDRASSGAAATSSQGSGQGGSLVPALASAGVFADGAGLATPPFGAMQLSSLGGAASGGGDGGSGSSREALTFVLSEEGGFFREFVLDEVVKSIDALSRDQLVLLASSLGVSSLAVPVPLPGAINSLQLVPEVSEEDRKQVENVTKMVQFLVAGGSSGGNSSGTLTQEQLAEIAPLLPRVASQVLPELTERLTSRVAARAIREVFLPA
eukprot:PRCOL_00001464-RA